eukprot:4711103-Amphidinium_carterae.1
MCFCPACSDFCSASVVDTGAVDDMDPGYMTAESEDSATARVMNVCDDVKDDLLPAKNTAKGTQAT